MNYTDLLFVVGIGSGIFGILVALTRQQQFLLKAVNPHRLTWLISAVSVMWVGLSIMRLEAGNWDLHTWLNLFAALVSDEKTSAQVKVASLAIFFGILLIAIVATCVVLYPRDPTTFRSPSDRQAAFRYYVRLRGGLDFALLAMGDGEVLIEEADLRQIDAWCAHLPKVQIKVETPVLGEADVSTGGASYPRAQVVGEPPRARTADDQVSFWRLLARRLHEQMHELDNMVGIANQGHNRRMVFDCEFGGFFFRYLRLPDPLNKADSGLYLFGATLNQMEMSNGRAEQHFQLLLDALRHIDRAVRVA